MTRKSPKPTADEQRIAAALASIRADLPELADVPDAEVIAEARQIAHGALLALRAWRARIAADQAA